MEKNFRINDCVDFKNELHQKLYIKSGASNFRGYIEYINAMFPSENESAESNTTEPASPEETVLAEDRMKDYE